MRGRRRLDLHFKDNLYLKRRVKSKYLFRWWNSKETYCSGSAFTDRIVRMPSWLALRSTEISKYLKLEEGPPRGTRYSLRGSSHGPVVCECRHLRFVGNVLNFRFVLELLCHHHCLPEGAVTLYLLLRMSLFKSGSRQFTNRFATDRPRPTLCSNI